MENPPQVLVRKKIRIVLDGLLPKVVRARELDSSSSCRQEGINSNLYYRWSKDFLEAGNCRRLSGDTVREAK